jgi:hypothetical protein
MGNVETRRRLVFVKSLDVSGSKALWELNKQDELLSFVQESASAFIFLIALSWESASIRVEKAYATVLRPEQAVGRGLKC